MELSIKQKKELSFAHKLGFIESVDEKNLEALMEKKNKALDEYSYGCTSYNEYSFVRYILAKFRMEFVFERLNYPYRSISQNEISEYYLSNKDEFYRENGDYFSIEDVKQVIAKRLREREYEEAINDLLH